MDRMEGTKKFSMKIGKINREIQFLDKGPQPDSGAKYVIGELKVKKKKFSAKMNKHLMKSEPYKVNIFKWYKFKK